MRGFFVSIFLAALAGSAYAQKSGAWKSEPDGFNGIKFGQKFSELDLERCPGTVTVFNVHLEDSNCFLETSNASMRYVTGLPFPYARAATVFLDDAGKVKSFRVDLPREDFAQTVEVFIERYGKPTKRKVESVENLQGTKFDSLMLEWVGPNVTIGAYEMLTTIDRSVISLATNESNRTAEDKRNKRLKEAAGKL